TDTVGKYTSIELDSNANARISYFDETNGDLKYAYVSCGYILAGDKNDDCIFNFIDIAILAKGWLVDCIENPGDPNCIPK
ncbi:MAG: hypothetical protein ACYSTX_06420, partial [Planctomycetota bacterium]